MEHIQIAVQPAPLSISTKTANPLEVNPYPVLTPTTLSSVSSNLTATLYEWNQSHTSN